MYTDDHCIVCVNIIGKVYDDWKERVWMMHLGQRGIVLIDSLDM